MISSDCWIVRSSVALLFGLRQLDDDVVAVGCHVECAFADPGQRHDAAAKAAHGLKCRRHAFGLRSIVTRRTPSGDGAR